MLIVGIDPGPRKSGFVVYDARREKVLQSGTVSNDRLERAIATAKQAGIRHACIERVQFYRNCPAGNDVFETVYYSGRFAVALELQGVVVARVRFPEIRLHIVGETRASESHVRQALIDRFGPGREHAIGIKHNPGPLYGVTKHAWSALACAVWLHDSLRQTATHHREPSAMREARATLASRRGAPDVTGGDSLAARDETKQADRLRDASRERHPGNFCSDGDT